MADPHQAAGERLQKVMAHAGVAPRRVSEKMIAAGRVKVDGVVVRELGTRVDPAKQSIYVDGERLVINNTSHTYAFHKPWGVVSTMRDEENRPCIGDYTADLGRVFHVGRLDQDSEGLILLTDDGELAHRLSHPSFKIPKRYFVTVQGELLPGERKALLRGIELEDGIAKADKVSVKEVHGGLSLLDITLHSGKNRIVRRMLKAIGHPVHRLVRVEVGPIKLGKTRPATVRALNNAELSALLTAVGM